MISYYVYVRDSKKSVSALSFITGEISNRYLRNLSNRELSKTIAIPHSK